MNDSQSPVPINWLPFQILTGVLAALPGGFAFLLIRANFLEPFNWKAVAFVMFLIALALVGWWFAGCWQRARQRSAITWALIGGGVLGVIGLLIGFVGPLIAAPEANQGPLLGIIITGPIGFVIGIVAGAFVGLFRGRSSSRV